MAATKKKKKAKAQEPAAAESEKKPAVKEQGILTHARVPLAGVVAGFVIAVLLSIFLLGLSINSEHSEALAQKVADNLQFQIDQREASLIGQMQEAATSILLTQLVTGDDETARNLEEARLRELIPHAIRVRLIPLGTARIDREANPPFSFTSKDLVNRVERGEGVYSEAINSGGNWVLSLAAPIRTPSEETVRGTLFVYLDMAALSSGLAAIAEGEVSLLQQFGNNEPSRILALGTPAKDAWTYTRTLSNPNWQLRYQPSSAITGATLSNLVELVLPALVFLLVALGAVMVGFRQLIDKMKSDTAQLANQMTDVVAGEYEHSSDYTFREFVDLDFNLSRLGVRAKEKPKVKPLDVKLQPKQTPANEMVDIEMIDEDEYEAALRGESVAHEEPEADAEETEDADALRAIFRAYDIRGVVGETLTPDVVRRIGLAIGTEARDLAETTLVVGYDGRTSSPEVAESLIDGLNAAGCDVINIGMVPTPVLYFATHNSETRSGVMVTASHNPPDYNGFKIVIDGRTLVEEDIARIYEKFATGDFATGPGTTTEIDISQEYADAIADDIVVAQPLKVVLDCGNGVSGKLAPELIENLGCDVVPLYCDVDGNFPNHPADTSDPENLHDLVEAVKAEGADLGIALDGDGDRMVAVTSSGEIVWPDRLMMLFAKDVVSRNPGADVVYDVKCTRHLNGVISGFGGRPIICRSGHSFIKAKIAETDAVLGGEFSGHICFSERWFGFDDGLYAAARLLELVGSQTEGLEELLKEFPQSVATPELHIRIPENEKFALMKRIDQNADFGAGTVTAIDGIRVDYANGWGLVRASNTGASITLRFEADDDAALAEIQGVFQQQLQSIDKRLKFGAAA